MSSTPPRKKRGEKASEAEEWGLRKDREAALSRDDGLSGSNLGDERSRCGGDCRLVVLEAGSQSGNEPGTGRDVGNGQNEPTNDLPEETGAWPERGC